MTPDQQRERALELRQPLDTTQALCQVPIGGSVNVTVQLFHNGVVRAFDDTFDCCLVGMVTSPAASSAPFFNFSRGARNEQRMKLTAMFSDAGKPDALASLSLLAVRSSNDDDTEWLPWQAFVTGSPFELDDVCAHWPMPLLHMIANVVAQQAHQQCLLG